MPFNYTPYISVACYQFACKYHQPSRHLQSMYNDLILNCAVLNTKYFTDIKFINMIIKKPNKVTHRRQKMNAKVKSKYSVLHKLHHYCGSYLICPTLDRILHCFLGHFAMPYQLYRAGFINRVPLNFERPTQS